MFSDAESAIDSASGTPRLQYITHSKYEADWCSVPHSHPFAEFICIESGEGQYRIDTNTYYVQRGALIVIPANRLHTEQSSETDPLAYYAMGVANISLHVPELSPEEDKTMRPLIFSLGAHTEQVRSLFAGVYREIKKQEAGYELMAASLLFQFIVFLLRQTPLAPCAGCEPPPRLDFAAVKEYIDEHYTDRITLAQLADVAHTSKFHLSHKFSEQMGIPPVAYLIEKRITEAKQLLVSTQMSVADIASAVGFPSACQFSQRFKRSAGCSPAEYRRCRHSAGHK